MIDAGSEELFGTPEERYSDYEVYDQYGERIGPLNDLFVDEMTSPSTSGSGTSCPRTARC